MEKTKEEGEKSKNKFFWWLYFTIKPFISLYQMVLQVYWKQGVATPCFQ